MFVPAFVGYAVAIVAAARLTAYAIADEDRWRRLAALVLIMFAAAYGWWMLTHGIP